MLFSTAIFAFALMHSSKVFAGPPKEMTVRVYEGINDWTEFSAIHQDGPDGYVDEDGKPGHVLVPAFDTKGELKVVYEDGNPGIMYLGNFIQNFGSGDVIAYHDSERGFGNWKFVTSVEGRAIKFENRKMAVKNKDGASIAIGVVGPPTEFESNQRSFPVRPQENGKKHGDGKVEVGKLLEELAGVFKEGLEITSEFMSECTATYVLVHGKVLSAVPVVTDEDVDNHHLWVTIQE